MKSFRRRFRFRVRHRRLLKEFLQHLRQKRKWLVIGTASAVAVVVIVIVASVNPVTAANAMAATSGALAGSENNTIAAAETATVTSSSPEPALEPTPTPTPDPTLKQGDQNERVQQLQERLMELGYLDIDESTQLYGPATEYAVELFERQHSMEQDGSAGPEVLDLI